MLKLIEENFSKKVKGGVIMDKKTTGWVSYLGWIGWLIAFLAGDKEGAKFHLNQSLLVNIGYTIGLIVSPIPFLGWVVGPLWLVFCFVCWILGLLAAINEEEKEIPLFGQIRILK